LSAQGVSTGIGKRPLFTGVWISTSRPRLTAQDLDDAERHSGDPIQRGGICGGSTAGTCSTSWIFRSTARPHLVAGEDGCVGPCGQGGGIAFRRKLITRQSGGKRMLATFDPVEPALGGAPNVNATIDAAKTQVSLQWQTPDNGGSDITGYNVLPDRWTGSPS